MTAITYIPGMLIGYGIIRAGWLDGFNLARQAASSTRSSASCGVPSSTSPKRTFQDGRSS